MPDLIQPRAYHSCARIGEKIIVAGGLAYIRGYDYTVLASTEIIPILPPMNFTQKMVSTSTGIPRTGGKLNYARTIFGLVTVGGLFPRILAFGGFGENGRFGNSQITAIIEHWNDQKEEWILAAPFSMKKPLADFGILAVPAFP